ncbi:MAG: transporter substrate-binding domain-containing protein [Motiliproteus sp.]
MRLAISFILLCIINTGLRAETLTAAADPWPPYVGPQLAGQGLAAQIVRAALKREGFDLEISFMPWARALRLTRNGATDLLVSAWWTQERSVYLHYSEPYAVNNLKFIKRKQDPFEFEGLHSLAGKRIGVVRDYGYGDAFGQADNFQQVENSDFLHNIRMLKAGRIDLTLEDELVATTILRQQAPEQQVDIAFSQQPLRTKSLHVASGRDNPRHQQIISAFNRGLTSLRADGTLARLLEQQH